LKSENEKAPVDVLIVNHAGKTPLAHQCCFGQRLVCCRAYISNFL